MFSWLEIHLSQLFVYPRVLGNSVPKIVESIFSTCTLSMFPSKFHLHQSRGYPNTNDLGMGGGGGGGVWWVPGIENTAVTRDLGTGRGYTKHRDRDRAWDRETMLSQLAKRSSLFWSASFRTRNSLTN